VERELGAVKVVSRAREGVFRRLESEWRLEQGGAGTLVQYRVEF
jgi:hypothetical protein